MATANAPTQQMSPETANALARAALLAQAVEMFQPIQSQTVNPAQVNPITFTLKNVGLLRSIFFTVTATIANNDGALNMTLTNIGLANFFSNILFTDLSNNQRINCPLWYLSWLNSIRHRKPYASGYAVETDTMGGYGENFAVLAAPTTINHGATGDIRLVFEIPVSYSDDDLRGAILMNVINANATVSLTVNTGMFATAGTDSTFALYKGVASANAAVTSCTVTMYQNYLDKLPRDQRTGAVIVPNLDLSTVYELKTSTVTGMTANQEYGYQYPNYREILSTTFIYNHDTSGDAGRAAGTDVNYFALQSANFTNVKKYYPLDLCIPTRQIINCDFPVGGYHYSSRRKPISSLQYGNMEWILNASTATANAALYVGLEMFNQPNVVVNAGSLQAQ